jgi:hypothetical protein
MTDFVNLAQELIVCDHFKLSMNCFGAKRLRLRLLNPTKATIVDS